MVVGAVAEHRLIQLGVGTLALNWRFKGISQFGLLPTNVAIMSALPEKGSFLERAEETSIVMFNHLWMLTVIPKFEQKTESNRPLVLCLTKDTLQIHFVETNHQDMSVYACLGIAWLSFPSLCVAPQCERLVLSLARHGVRAPLTT